MTTPRTTVADWRAQVDKELAGRSFEKSLVHESLEGIPIAPLYTEAPALPRVTGDGAPFRICMRHEGSATAVEVAEDLEGGADGLWIAKGAAATLPERVAPHVVVIVDVDDASCLVGGETVALASTLAFHDAGADAVEEIALGLSTCVARIAAGAGSLLLRVAVGRDTFIELSKLRAMRLCLQKVLAAYGDPSLAAPRIHAVCSGRTIAARDPWVNMLRVTTQMFAAVLGGADLVTPQPFDRALEARSALGRRVARNTGHVLREESALGRVTDPGAGSYYFDSLTDALARAAWTRFQAIEREGGIDAGFENGSIDARIASTRRARQAQIATRKLPILGVSEFANLGEKLPSPPRAETPSTAYRDAVAFEALRTRADAHPLDVLLFTLGPPEESRARVGFASSLFAAGGMPTREITAATRAPVVCICGTDERYAAESVAAAAALKAAGCRRVLVAGRPGAIEAEQRAAGVDGYIFLGCDAVAVLDAALAAGASS